MIRLKKPKNRWVVTATSEDWQAHFEWFLRWWSIGGAALIDTGIVAYLWKEHQQLAIFAIAVGVAVCGILISLRLVRARTAKIGAAFHRFSHLMRDEFGEIHALAKAGRSDGYTERLRQIHNHVAESLAVFFRAFVGDASVNCAIRISKEESDNRVYPTVGRSAGMEPNRKKNSIPVPHDQGVAGKLSRHKEQGVVFVYSIQEAIKEKWWPADKDERMLPNDKLPDVKTMMIAPINGVVEVEPTMLGILYVTSGWSARFSPFTIIHMDTMRAFADLLGALYPHIHGDFTLERSQSNESGPGH